MRWEREIWLGAFAAAVAGSVGYSFAMTYPPATALFWGWRVEWIAGLFALVGFLTCATGLQIQSDGLKGWASQYFGIDIRSLAVLRIGMASAVLVDLASRARDLTAHYSNDGILALDVVFSKPSVLSLHMLSGETWVQGVLFAVAAVFGVLMLVGWWTRIATAASWFLLISLQTRNPDILTGGDTMLRVLMFWCMFLPIGARFSVDSALNVSLSARRKRIADLATLGILVQLACIYGFSALLKTGDHWRVDGSAAFYALSLDMMTTPFGQWMSGFHRLLRGSTFFVLYLELIAPLVIFCPWRSSVFRSVLFLLLFSMHLMFQWTMYLGIFPFVGMVAVFALIPTCVWDWASRRLRDVRLARPVIYYDHSCGFCRKMVLLWRTVLMTGDVRIRRGNVDQRIEGLIKQHNSWVVVDHRGEPHFRFDGLLVLMRYNWLFKPVAKLLSFGPFAKCGEALYRQVAANRPTLGWLTRGLTIRRQTVRSLRLVEPFLLACIMFVVLFNCRSLKNWNMSWFQNGSSFEMLGQQRRINLVPIYKAGRQLRLDQNWTLFAPYPFKRDGWFVAEGHTKYGQIVDVRTGEPPVFTKPDNVAATYTNHRWRKYLEKLATSNPNLRSVTRYCQFLCRQWNETHDEDQHLTRIELTHVLERSRPPSIRPRHVRKTFGAVRCDWPVKK